MFFNFPPRLPSSFWRIPADIGAAEDKQAISISSERVDWLPRPRSPDHASSSPSSLEKRSSEIHQVLSTNDLYHILGVPRAPVIDRLALRRAYLARSKACHPDKFPGNPDATHAFQRVSIAYDVLSKPSSKRAYDSRPSHAQHDFFASGSENHADETFKGVLISIISDFLDGDLEMIHTLLRAISDLNPSLKLGDEGINSVLSVLQRIRERILTCRACIIALHAELARVLELQSAFRQLPYFDITGRSRLTIQLTRITLFLPVTLEKAIQEQQNDFYSGQQPTNHEWNNDNAALLPKRVVLLIRGIDVVLDRMERVLG